MVQLHGPMRDGESQSNAASTRTMAGRPKLCFRATGLFDAGRKAMSRVTNPARLCPDPSGLVHVAGSGILAGRQPKGQAALAVTLENRGAKFA